VSLITPSVDFILLLCISGSTFPRPDLPRYGNLGLSGLPCSLFDIRSTN
jgi:hypothetical protein